MGYLLLKDTMKSLVIIIGVLVLVFKGYPMPVTYYTSTTNGSWVLGANWSTGTSPEYNPTSNTANITVSNNITLVSAFELKGGTTLTITSGDTLTITGNVQFNNGSILVIQAGGVLIINGNVTNNNNSDDISVNGTIVINGNFTGGNGSAIVGIGSMDISGTVTTTGNGSVFGSETDCAVANTCDNSASDPLPIDLLFFKGNCTGHETVELEWATASEINNDYFEILKSLTTIGWEVIGKVNGAGNSNTTLNYSYYDLKGISETMYYILNQCDFDGICTKSTIISVKCGKDAGIKMVKIYDLLGREVSSIKEGGYLVIEYYNNNKTIKKIVRE